MLTGTCPQERRASNRKRALRRTWSSKEWNLARKKFLLEHPICELHQKEGITVIADTPHHPYMESIKAGYLDLSRCIALCKRCHTALHHGLNLCPKCKEHYKRWDQPECRRCFDKANPEIVRAREAAKEERKRIRRELDKKKRMRMKEQRKKATRLTG